jgi:2,5-dihydroxypyridine 5,6-dioxygenase
VVGGNWGSTTRPGTLTHWPGGLVLAFPAAGSVNGTLVLAEGDVNLTFKRYIERAITLTVEDDHVTRIEGTGVDAELLRSYFSAWDAAEDFAAGSPGPAYAVSHVGYGLNDAARWDSMALYDKRDFNGTELRAFAGNFLYSTGANEVAGRHTRGHFDWPMRGCTVQLDGHTVVNAGKVVDA